MNAVVFVLVGLLIGLGVSKWPWWKAIGVGCLISISIEVLMFIFKRGFSEEDDVIHNTLGCAVGFGIAKLTMIVYSSIIKQSN